MTKADKTLDQMRANPRDWRIEDLEAAARRLGLMVRKPGGSHVIFQKSGCSLEVSVRRLIDLIDAEAER